MSSSVALKFLVLVCLTVPQYSNAERSVESVRQRRDVAELRDELQSELSDKTRSDYHLIRSRRQSDSDKRNIESLFKRLTVNYDKNAVPLEGSKSDEGTQVSIAIYVLSLTPSHQDMSCDITFYLRQAWNDPRLKFSPQSDSEKKLSIPLEAWKQLWVPDVFIRNGQESKIHDVTVDNRMMKLEFTGDIFSAIKITAKLNCPMNFASYPMDEQHCPMFFESFSHPWNEMSLHFMTKKVLNPVEIAESLHISHYSLVNTTTSDCSKQYASEKYPCLEIQFHLKRYIGYHLLQTYMPSFLILLLSWMQFWMKAKDTTGRILVGLLSMLAMLMISHQAAEDGPEVSYMTAMDLWIGVCLFFIFSSLVELLIVLNTQQSSEETDNKLGTGDAPHDRTSKIMQALWNPEGFGKVDTVARIVFPAVFLLFNIFYWPFYSY